MPLDTGIKSLPVPEVKERSRKEWKLAWSAVIVICSGGRLFTQNLDNRHEKFRQ